MGNWREKLEISIVHPGLWPSSASDVKEWEHSVRSVLEDPFFERIEIAPIADQQRRQQFNEWLRIANMKATYLLQPLIFGNGYDLQSSDTGEKMLAVNRIIEAMDEAVESGADRVAVISGPKAPQEDTEAQLDRLCDLLLLLDQAATERKLQLDLELFDTDVDKKRLFGDSTMAAKLMGRLEKQTTNLSLLVDLSHVPLLRETIEDTVFNTKTWLGHVHIGNCSTKRDDARYGDKHPYFGYPNGCHHVTEVTRFLQALHDVGYLTLERKAGLGIEIMTAVDEEPGLLIAGAKRTLIQALQNIKVDGRKGVS
ncbi:TIM barrel protein [Paenibacillus terreus]|uniref:TIM barrel protein n=1 Tax=Paenibacillus terreus TaxID=1387834 RepID=A0ABV5B7E0_9BACL